MLTNNVLKRLQKLTAPQPTAVGTVSSVSSGVAVVTLMGGGTVQARGSATVGQRVFVTDGRIDGVAPTLTYVEVDI